jgi:hypothetical protein
MEQVNRMKSNVAKIVNTMHISEHPFFGTLQHSFMGICGHF